MHFLPHPPYSRSTQPFEQENKGAEPLDGLVRESTVVLDAQRLISIHQVSRDSQQIGTLNGIGKVKDWM